MPKQVFMRQKLRLPYQMVSLELEVTALQPLSTQARAALQGLQAGLGHTGHIEQAMGVTGSEVLQKELLQFMLEGLTVVQAGQVALTALGQKVLQDGNRRETIKLQQRYLVDRFAGNRLVLARNAARSRTREDTLPNPDPVEISATMVEFALLEEPRFHQRQIKVTEVEVTQQQFMVVEHEVLAWLDPELPNTIELEVRDRGGKPAPHLTQVLTKSQWQKEVLPACPPSKHLDAWKLLRGGWELEDTLRPELRKMLERSGARIEIKDSRWVSTDLVLALLGVSSVRVVIDTLSITPAWQQVVDAYPGRVKLQKTASVQRLILLDGHEVARGREALLKHQYGGTLVDLMWLNPPEVPVGPETAGNHPG